MSSCPLVKGATGSRDQLEGQWVSYGININKDIQTYTLGSKSYPKYHSICFDEDCKGWPKRTDGCRAHMIMVPVDKSNVGGDWVVKSIQLLHTCPPNAKKRKRQYQTQQVAKIAPDAVSGYTTTDQKKGNTKQFRTIVKATTGVDMGKGQANLHIHNISHDKLHQQIAQYFWIPSIIEEVFAKDDPEGTYKYETVPCLWNTSKRQFKRCYVCPSFTKHLWRKGVIRMIVADGTFTKGIDFKHIVLLAVTFDAENKIVVLAAAIVPVEDADNWVWFHGNLRVDIPGFDVFMSDADKGITSNAFTASQRQVLSQNSSSGHAERSRCARHLATNCREKCKGKMNEDDKNQINELAASRTEVVYRRRLAEIEKKNDSWAKWLDARKSQFVAYTFIIRGLRRWGKTTSNGVENANGAILPLRYEPIAYLLLEIVMYMQDKYIKGKNRANKLVAESKTITTYAAKSNSELLAKASKLPVTIIEDTRNSQEEGNMVRARVGLKPNAPVTSTYEVKIDTENHTAECPCLLYEEWGIYCSHVKALLLAANEDPNSIHWIHKRYHASNYAECYDKSVPAFSTAGKLSVDESCIPPEYTKSAGRPKTKRNPREEHESTTSVRRTCGACGELGHFTKSCEKPSTKYRYNKNEKKAVRWATDQQSISVVLDPTHDDYILR